MVDNILKTLGMLTLIVGGTLGMYYSLGGFQVTYLGKLVHNAVMITW